MISFIINNVATLLISLALVAIASAVIISMIKKRREGRRGCSFQCEGCVCAKKCENRNNNYDKI